MEIITPIEISKIVYKNLLKDVCCQGHFIQTLCLLTSLFRFRYMYNKTFNIKNAVGKCALFRDTEFRMDSIYSILAI